MNTRNRQKGMTMIGWLFLLAMLGFLVMIVLRLSPAYIEYFSVLNSVKAVAEQSTEETSLAEMRAGIGRRFIVNNVTRVRPAQIALAREDNRVFLHIKYEARTPMMFNVEAVVVFDERVEVGRR